MSPPARTSHKNIKRMSNAHAHTYSRYLKSGNVQTFATHKPAYSGLHITDVKHLHDTSSFACDDLLKWAKSQHGKTQTVSPSARGVQPQPRTSDKGTRQIQSKWLSLFLFCRRCQAPPSTMRRFASHAPTPTLTSAKITSGSSNPTIVDNPYLHQTVAGRSSHAAAKELCSGCPSGGPSTLTGAREP